MRTEKILWWLAIACAFVLLTGIFPFWRTVWIRGGGYTRDSAGWDLLAALSGIVALIGLGTGAWARPRVVVSVLGAVTAAVVFAVAAYAAGSYLSAILTGMVMLEGGALGSRRSMHASAAVPVFAVLATVGAGSALALAFNWLRPTEFD